MCAHVIPYTLSKVIFIVASFFCLLHYEFEALFEDNLMFKNYFKSSKAFKFVTIISFGAKYIFFCFTVLLQLRHGPILKSPFI